MRLQWQLAGANSQLHEPAAAIDAAISSSALVLALLAVSTSLLHVLCFLVLLIQAACDNSAPCPLYCHMLYKHIRYSCRLLALTELQRLPVIHRSRLHKSAVTHVAYNPDGTCLAVAAAADKRVALLSLRGCEHVDVLGYFTAAGKIQPHQLHVSSPCMAWHGMDAQVKVRASSA